MTDLLLLYALLKLDAVHSALTVAACLIFFGLCVLTPIYYADGLHVDYVKGKRVVTHLWRFGPAKLAIRVLLVCVALLMFLPNTKQAAVLIAGHYTIEAVSTAEGQKLLQVLRMKANEYLDEQIGEGAR